MKWNLQFTRFSNHGVWRSDKRQYGLTHIVFLKNFHLSFLKANMVESKFFFKSTHGWNYVSFSKISSKLWSRVIKIWPNMICHFVHLILYYFTYFTIFNQGQYGLTHINLSEKKIVLIKSTPGSNNCIVFAKTFSNFIPRYYTVFKLYCPLKFSGQVSTKALLFSKAIYFSLFTFK